MRVNFKNFENPKLASISKISSTWKFEHAWTYLDLIRKKSAQLHSEVLSFLHSLPDYEPGINKNG